MKLKTAGYTNLQYFHQGKITKNCYVKKYVTDETILLQNRSNCLNFSKLHFATLLNCCIAIIILVIWYSCRPIRQAHMFEFRSATRVLLKKVIENEKNCGVILMTYFRWPQSSWRHKITSYVTFLKFYCIIVDF